MLGAFTGNLGEGGAASTAKAMGGGALEAAGHDPAQMIEGIGRSYGDSLADYATLDARDFADVGEGLSQWLFGKKPMSKEEEDAAYQQSVVARRGQEDVLPGIAGYGRDVSSTAREALEANVPKYPVASPAGLIERGTKSAPSVIGPLVATALTRGKAGSAPLAAIGAGVFGQSYSDAIAEGRDPSEAGAEAAFRTASELVPERMVLGPLLKPGSSLGRRVIGSMFGEGNEEVVTEAANMAYEVGVLGDDITAREALSRIGESWAVGGFMGGVVGAGAHPFVSGSGEVDDAGDAGPDDLAPITLDSLAPKTQAYAVANNLFDENGVLKDDSEGQNRARVVAMVDRLERTAETKRLQGMTPELRDKDLGLGAVRTDRAGTTGPKIDEITAARDAYRRAQDVKGEEDPFSVGVSQEFGEDVTHPAFYGEDFYRDLRTKTDEEIATATPSEDGTILRAGQAQRPGVEPGQAYDPLDPGIARGQELRSSTNALVPTEGPISTPMTEREIFQSRRRTGIDQRPNEEVARRRAELDTEIATISDAMQTGVHPAIGNKADAGKPLLNSRNNKPLPRMLRLRSRLASAERELAGIPPISQLIAPEGRAAQTQDQARMDRQASDAIRLRDRQQERLYDDEGNRREEVKDVQTAGREEGFDPTLRVPLLHGEPVEIVSEDRSDPKRIIVRPVEKSFDAEGTAIGLKPVEGMAPASVLKKDIKAGNWAPEPRRAQDYGARAIHGTRTGPRGTYLKQGQDPNEQFPAAGEGRSPIPPQGPQTRWQGQAWQTEEEVQDDFNRRQEEARTRGEEFKPKGRKGKEYQE
ncbi:MAG TPA: hypothetical protein VM537_34610, partial [Anaerolineae bacterium]|nr:hypothetical protein [Anaerolineae bacterium]